MSGLVKLFGETLLTKDGDISTAEALKGKDCVGIYFSAHWCPPCRGFTPKLAEIYKDLRESGKNFEIVFVSSDRDADSFKSYFNEMPWLSIPYEPRSLKNALSKKYKVSGIPSLVLVDGQGNTISKDGRAAVSSDPKGAKYPWAPKTKTELLMGKYIRNDGTETTDADFKGKILGLYFSAHWCPPCRGFTPELVKRYNLLKEQGKKFEVIFVSGDNDEAEFKDYFKEMPWLSIPYEDEERRNELNTVFEVQGIPTLVMLDENLKMITDDGRAGAGADETCKDFPWREKAVKDIAQGPHGINETPSLIIMMDGLEDNEDEQKRIISELEPIANEHFAAGEASEEGQSMLFFYAVKEDRVLDQIRKLTKFGAPKPEAQMVLMDLGDNGGFYTGDFKVTASGIKDFIAAFKEGKLTRQQVQP